jgi:osmotically-inducible protein OsmY
MKAIWMIPVVAMAIGCSQKDTDQVQSDAQNLAKETGQAASSLTLEGKVNTVLRSMKWIDNSDVKVDAKDGVVTLSGSAADDHQKKEIVETTNAVKGVDKVVDHMVVGKTVS